MDRPPELPMIQLWAPSGPSCHSQTTLQLVCPPLPQALLETGDDVDKAMSYKHHYYVLVRLCYLLAPITPFLAEGIL